jgi:NitT/TauT family transport system permease protein
LVGSDIFLPPPEKVMIDLFEIILEPYFAMSVTFTLIRYIIGFILALSVSLIVGILAGISEGVYSLIRPVLVIFRSVPVISFILLALIWFSNTSVPVFISFVTMFPIICMNIIDGIRQIDYRYFELTSAYGIGRLQQLREVILPAISPFLFSGVATAIGFGWRAVIIGEVLSQPETGIGTQMQNAQIYLLVGHLIAWTIVAIFISYIFDVILRKMEGIIFKWRNL